MITIYIAIKPSFMHILKENILEYSIIYMYIYFILFVQKENNFS